jgi:hypothetical protein
VLFSRCRPPVHVACRQSQSQPQYILQCAILFQTLRLSHAPNAAFPYDPILYLPWLSPMVILRTKLTITAANSAIARMVGPSRSSNPPCPRIRMLLARQWKVNSAYTIAIIATIVNRPALILPTLSPKLRSPIASPPRMTVKLSHERKVRSLAKKTLGSTRVGRAMRLPVRTR